MSKKITVLFCLGLLLTGLFRCGRNSEVTEAENKTYLNLNDTVKYVGIETCRQCHYSTHSTFIHTGMGSSFGMADTSKSVANISESTIVHDRYSGFTYHPYWKKDSLFLDEFRLNKKGDTTHKHSQRIDYVVGSGQHTNSHLFKQGELLYQAPFTWYTQKDKADLPPGYENGHNLRFNRVIGLECTSCHNEMPTGFVMGSANRYTKVPGAINCERCHGPGEVHVRKMKAGDYVDTAFATDYSIVNPKKLTVELQFEICQRCHLQGNAVLADDRSFFDFKPGMKLAEVMDVYLPRYTKSDNRFIMASHVDRFKLSQCFKQSEGYNCASCHNPHISVRETNVQKFNNQCRSCHNPKGKTKFECTAAPEELQLKSFNCVECHMPASDPVDIPHVTVHDHYVRKPQVLETDTSGLSEFLGLVAINNSKPGLRSKTMAYLQQYERFDPFPYYLDSAFYFLQKLDPDYEDVTLWVHYLFLKQDHQGIINLVQAKGKEKALSALTEKSYSNRDAWAAYRIGESFYRLGKPEKSVEFYQRASELAPFVPDFQSKLGVAFLQLRQMERAVTQFSKTLELKPDHREALNNMGYVLLLKREFKSAEKYLTQAVDADPDYKLAWLNLANVHLQSGNKADLKKCLMEVLRIEPENQQAKQLLSKLKA